MNRKIKYVIILIAAMAISILRACLESLQKRKKGVK